MRLDWTFSFAGRLSPGVGGGGGGGRQKCFCVALFKRGRTLCFLGIQNNLKICGNALVSRPHNSANKVQPNLFCGCSYFTHNIASVS